jgi:hypothetical protein
MNAQKDGNMIATNFFPMGEKMRKTRKTKIPAMDVRIGMLTALKIGLAFALTQLVVSVIAYFTMPMILEILGQLLGL